MRRHGRVRLAALRTTHRVAEDTVKGFAVHGESGDQGDELPVATEVRAQRLGGQERVGVRRQRHQNCGLWIGEVRCLRHIRGHSEVVTPIWLENVTVAKKRNLRFRRFWSDLTSRTLV